MLPLHWLTAFSALLLATACASTGAVEQPPPREGPAEQAGEVYPRPSASSSPTPGTPGGNAGRPPRLAEVIESEGTPCQRCTVGVDGRFRGRFRDDIDTCGDLGAKLNYPLGSPVIQVLEGAQAGRYFPIGGRAAKLPTNRVIEVELGPEAKPEGWWTAILWVTDASGRPCASSLTIVRR